MASPGASGGSPPDENVSKNTQKNVFRSIKIRKQISVKKYSAKHLPLHNPLERGGLGGAHLDNVLQYQLAILHLSALLLNSLGRVDGPSQLKTAIVMGCRFSKI